MSFGTTPQLRLDSLIVDTKLSGSLQQLANGSSYLVAGTNVTITSQSNGQIAISATGGGSSPAPVSVTTDYTIGAFSSGQAYFADLLSANVIITLPTAVGVLGILNVKKIDSSGFTVIISASGGQSIDGQSNQTITSQWANLQLTASGSNWYIL